jgi:zinc protease
MPNPLRTQMLSLTLLLTLALAGSSLANPPHPATETAPSTDFTVGFETFTLDNGLRVVFHTDHSDPVVAVALTFHVGSARELPGRTGFAHLFEHLLFLDSENLGYGGLDRLSTRIGGSGANGSTSRDRTDYHQAVPSNALEKLLWAEAEKLGFFINTVNESVLEKEKQVVKNEKRQGVDNVPYGHNSYVLHKNLYPAGHPYSWQVIGSLDDLQAATLDDVVNFYNTWYVPNNAILAVSGDFNPAQAREWVEKYFGEIPRGADIEPLEVQPAGLTETRSLYHEDNFARLPQLSVVWPSVENFHPDAYALEMLTSLLADGKNSPLYQVLVEEKNLAPGVNMYSRESEIAGEVHLQVRAFPGTDLNEVYAAIGEAFSRFEERGFTDADMDRIKAGQETSFYNRLTSVHGKAIQLTRYYMFAGDPGYITRDLERRLAVTREDVMRVYEQYIKDMPKVMTSFVPRGQTELALAGAIRAEVVEEEIVMGAEADVVVETTAEFERTPSSFDRSVEPPFGPEPEIRIPDVWTTSLGNGLPVYGIEYDELPIVQFELRLRGGMLLDDPEKVGVASLTAEMMNRGTRNRTAAELEEAIDQLGSRIRVSAGPQHLSVSGSSLARNFDATMALMTEMLLEPRWDEQEFELARRQALSGIAQRASNPSAIASARFSELVYGGEHILANHPAGTEESVEAITLDDLRQYYTSFISPDVAAFHLVGDVAEADVTASLARLESGWESRSVQFPEYTLAEAPREPRIWFHNVPGATQSQIRIGYPALPRTHPDFDAAEVMNFILGGAPFTSRLNQELREGKGYTYGIFSGFSGTDLPGSFIVSTGVRSNVTFESVELIRQILLDYADTFTEADLEDTRSSLLKSNARAFETPGAKLGMLRNMSAYGWPADFVRRQEEVVRRMTVERIRELARTYANADRMHYLIVGDAATQLEPLTNLGLGTPVLFE